ncbi:hypothetical protein EVAR_28749_1 [Eumeta japonica]|uniref:Uncharacterized protein n=1 Tax=Eumeta variegata TaxID=151549 RepID=A0A4C1Z2A3_EUMVA|nr:hypothetical protein EVAR_28749_1 [Eumeta japonica]
MVNLESGRHYGTPLIGVLDASGANAYVNEVHGHASPIKMYATHMCNGCTTYKMQWEWCIRHVQSVFTLRGDRSCLHDRSEYLHTIALRFHSFRAHSVKTVCVVSSGF